eukprot:3205295-Pyramimonas_sp.AAC.1
MYVPRGVETDRERQEPRRGSRELDEEEEGRRRPDERMSNGCSIRFWDSALEGREQCEAEGQTDAKECK